MKFQTLTDEEWEFLKQYLPPHAKTGRHRTDDRKTINGIIFVIITGCKWADMPKEYGAYVTAWRRLKRWQEGGAWENITTVLRNNAYESGKLSLEVVSIDSKTIEAKKGAILWDTTDIKR